ncbi:hypothetical protein CCZ01_00305 [Helicobacter monodelphidis]|uniref:major outer membrane protein n=1 Tax=Helicobacter sp. 15-1451 TaxID=2004995 RepID=UPI000DCE664F|nr:major outer membrane protein [Helicobacter sp. 15-1451]RAX59221.1 hypothetical protein CCZ01_00305 [Helicobacter sp. 15-1451]
MRMIKVSLAAVTMLGLFSGVSSAQTIEEAIKGTTVNGYLRYRANSDDYSDHLGVNGTHTNNTTHQYRAFAEIQTAPINSVSFNLGALYINEGATTNTGVYGTGLGAGEDGDFGVSTFYATVAPHQYTKTTIMLGKQILNTPVTDAGDFDRGTGILALNQDVAGLTVALGAYDTWSLSNITGYSSDQSVTKSIYVLAAIYNIPDMLTAQLWYFNIKDVADMVLYGEVAYDQKFGVAGARASATYARSTLGSLFAGQEKDNDLLKLNVGGDFYLGATSPIGLDVGYLMNTAPGYSALVDDQGKMINSVTMGQTWWQNAGTASSIGIGRRLTGVNSTPIMEGGEDKLGVLYASVGAKNIAETGLGIHLTYVQGSSEYSLNGVTSSKRDFTEIVPLINYAFDKKLSFQTYYSMLSTDIDTTRLDATTGVATPIKGTEKRNRFRFETLYKF